MGILNHLFWLTFGATMCFLKMRCLVKGPVTWAPFANVKTIPCLVFQMDLFWTPSYWPNAWFFLTVVVVPLQTNLKYIMPIFNSENFINHSMTSNIHQNLVCLILSTLGQLPINIKPIWYGWLLFSVDSIHRIEYPRI